MPNWKKVIVSGSNATLNSLFVSTSVTASIFSGSFTGSLQGTSSWAINALTASSAQNASDILRYVKNSSGAQINKGRVVRIAGAVGDNALIGTASYFSDNESANTLGITFENIANDSFGYVITEGTLIGINTDAFTAGQLIYLGDTGSIIGTAPVAPLHAVRLGQVLRSQLNNGSIYVRIDNGFELGELHDVRDTTTTGSYGDLLVKSGSIWINSKQLTGSYGLTGSLQATSFTGSLQGTSSWAQNAVTASFISGGISAFPYTGSARITGSLGVTGSISVSGSTGTVFFSNADTMTFTGSIFQTGSTVISGSLSVTNGITGSLLGTASWAQNALTASFFGGSVTSASYASSSTSASFASTASFVITAQTASYVLQAVSASFATLAQTANTASFVVTAQTASFVATASFASNANLLDGLDSTVFATTGSNTFKSNQIITGSTNITGSLTVVGSVSGSSFTGSLLGTATTASYVLQAVSASFATSAANATTASYILNAVSASYASSSTSASFALTASSAGDFLVRGTLTAQTIVAQVITSSTDFVTGSTRFGSLLANTHQFTGSVSITGSLNVTGAGITGSLFGTASWANNATSASYALNATSASYALSASFASQAANATSASYALNATSASYALNATSASFAPTATNVFLQGGNSFGTTALLGTNDVQNLQFETSGSVRMTISSSGNVGIGTTSPAYKLDVNGSAYSSLGLITQGYTIAASGLNIEMGTVSGYAQINSYNRTTSAYGSFRLDGSNIILNSASGGNVGIGTTSPTAKLHISGSNTDAILQITSPASASILVVSGSGNIGIGTTSPSEKLDVNGNIQIANAGYIKGSTYTGTKITIDNDLTLTANRDVYIDTGVVFKDSGNVGIGTTTPTAKLDVSGSTIITGSLTVITGSNIEFQVLNTGVRIGNLITDTHTVTGSLGVSGSVTATNFTGSLFGTASWANNATTSSYILNAVSASFASTASFVATAQTASFVTTAQTASYVLQAVSASYASASTSASFASTASSADNFLVRGTLTAQTIVVQTITSSVDFVTGSTRFGSLSSNTHQFTGSVSVSGSITGFDGVINNLTASFAQTASFVTTAQTASYVLQAISSSFSSTASSVNTLNQNVLINGGISASSYLYSTIDVIAQQNLKSLNSVGDEGGELLLGKPQTNTTLTGSGVTIDVYQNRLRFFEQGGDARGYFIDITGGGAGVSTNLVGGGGTPGGSNTQIQYNNAGAFAGVPTLTYDGTTLRATGSFTGSLVGALTGTASFATQAVTSSYANATSTIGYTIGGSQIYYNSTASSTSPSTVNIFTNNTGSFTSAFYNYTLASGSNARSGQISAVWVGNSISYNDYSTIDIGSTLAVTASVAIVTGQVQLNVAVPASTTGWNVKATVTYI